MQMTSPSSPFSPLARGVCCAHGQSTSPDECLIEKQQFQREGERFMRGSANIRDVSNLQCSGGPAIDRAPGCNVGSAVGAPPSLCPSCVLASSPSLLPSRPPPSRLCRSTSRLPFFPALGRGTPATPCQPCAMASCSSPGTSFPLGFLASSFLARRQQQHPVSWATLAVFLTFMVHDSSLCHDYPVAPSVCAMLFPLTSVLSSSPVC